MEWRRHASREHLEYIEKNHGTEHMKRLVTVIFDEAALHHIKHRLPESDRHHFETAWKVGSRPGSPFHGVKERVGEWIGDCVCELDDAAGSYGQRGLAWADQKARTVGNQIESVLFGRPQRA